MKPTTKFYAGAAIIMMAVVAVLSASSPAEKTDNLKRFGSGEELVEAFAMARQTLKGVVLETTAVQAASGVQYSSTNIQVEGVDEADIVKTDGNYIYAAAKNSIFIIKAYPASNAETLSVITEEGFVPYEMLVSGDRLLVFGRNEYIPKDPAAYAHGSVSVRLYDIADKSVPMVIKELEFEGSYLTSRMSGSYAYFVVNSYPKFTENDTGCEVIMPFYKEGAKEAPVAQCTDIGYIEPSGDSFITIASISLKTGELQKDTILGSGSVVYASPENLYIAQATVETTVIVKFHFDGGKISFVASGEVKGHALNQFSMDEYNGNFRIATTTSQFWAIRVVSIGQAEPVAAQEPDNNVYILDGNMKLIGSLENLAPGERIYSARFMGPRGYMVTFKQVDPLFVLDLSDAANPKVLGKLKIPGYSNYLHPLDSNRLLGIGKDTEEISGTAYYQGIKMAIFDVSDVENPVELHKVIIGTRGTDSEVLWEHKAFLLDEGRNLLALPVILYEGTNEWGYGTYVFQGLYVYNIENGFELKGRITQYSSEEFDNRYKGIYDGVYYDENYDIRRSLFIGDVLYTLSDSRLQFNDINTMEKLGAVELTNQ